MTKFGDLFNYRIFTPEYKRFIIFILGYAALYVPSQIINTGEISVSFIQTETGKTVGFTIDPMILIEIILPGFGLAILLFYIYRSLEKETAQNKRIIGYTVFFLIILYVFGNGIHIIANDLNNKFVDIFGPEVNGELANLYYAIYFWDEIVGHLVMIIPLYLIIYIFTYVSIGLENTERLSETAFAALCGIFFGGVMGYGCTEGQCSLAVLMVNLAGTSLIVVGLIKKGKKNLLSHPFSVFTIVQTAAYIIFTIYWGLTAGLKPYYPYFYQPEELTFLFIYF